MNWQAKVAIAVAVGVALVTMAVLAHHQADTILEQKLDNAALKSANGTLQVDAKLDDKADRVTDKVVADVTSVVRAIAPKQDRIEEVTQARKEAALIKYAAMPPATSHADAQTREAEQAREISEIQITSLWQTYCNAAPEAATCASIPKAP